MVYACTTFCFVCVLLGYSSTPGCDWSLFCDHGLDTLVNNVRTTTTTTTTWCSLSEKLLSCCTRHKTAAAAPQREPQVTRHTYMLVPVLQGGQRCYTTGRTARAWAGTPREVRIHQEALAGKGSCPLRTCQGHQRL